MTLEEFMANPRNALAIKIYKELLGKTHVNSKLSSMPLEDISDEQYSKLINYYNKLNVAKELKEVIEE